MRVAKLFLVVCLSSLGGAGFANAATQTDTRAKYYEYINASSPQAGTILAEIDASWQQRCGRQMPLLRLKDIAENSRLKSFLMGVIGQESEYSGILRLDSTTIKNLDIIRKGIDSYSCNGKFYKRWDSSLDLAVIDKLHYELASRRFKEKLDALKEDPTEEKKREFSDERRYIRNFELRNNKVRVFRGKEVKGPSGEVSCQYETPFAKAANEAYAAQFNPGRIRSANCDGIELMDFESIDFTKVDLSEVMRLW